MIKDHLFHYSAELDMNCAETILHAVADDLGWTLSDDTYKSVGCYGGGIGCGKMCGALAGAVAAIGIKYIDGTAHQSPLARQKATKMARDFVHLVGSDQCRDLTGKYRRPDVKCLPLITIAAELLQKLIDEETPA